MPITLATPITIPAQSEQVADTIWISSLQINAPTPTGKCSVTARLVPMVSSTGALINKEAKILVIKDVFATAATDSAVAAAMTAIFAAIQSQADAQGLFITPAP